MYLIVSLAFFILKTDAVFYFRQLTVVRVRLFSDIGHVITKIDWEGICTSSGRKLKHACTLLGFKNMTMYDRVKPATAGPADLFRNENAVFISFVIESEKKKS